MATLASAKQKYIDKVKVMPQNYIEGVAAFFGVAPGQVSGKPPAQNYVAKISPARAQQLGDKWERDLKAAWGL